MRVSCLVTLLRTSCDATSLCKAKLGLLPKRPVSLITPKTPASTTQSHGADDSSDDDELEYIENPFDDQHR